jgi:hypothetical protein
VGGIAEDGVCAGCDGTVGGNSSGTGGIGSSNSPAGLGGGTTRRATGALMGRASCRGRAFGRAFYIIGEDTVLGIGAGIGWTDGAMTGIGAGITGTIRSCSSTPLLKSESGGDTVSL